MNVSSRRIDTHAHIGARRGRAGRRSLQPDMQANYRSAVILRTRSRILEVAVQLYRQLGHRKTTVIDIAHEISMSPANCYRFFRSKQAIKEAVVGRLLEQVIVAAVDAARSDDSATVRLQAVLQEVERLHRNRFMQDKSLHDLVVTAMRENWTSVRPYSEADRIRRRTGHRGWANSWGISQRRLDDSRPLRACRNGLLYEPTADRSERKLCSANVWPYVGILR